MTKTLPAAPVPTPWETPDSSPGAKEAARENPSPKAPAPRRRRPIWQSTVATLLVMAFLAWAGYQCWIAGLAVRDRTWESTTSIRFNYDIGNALRQGSDALAAERDAAHIPMRKPLTVWQSVMGMQQLYDNLLKRTADPDNGNFMLDYPPGRLFIATMWARWAQMHYPNPDGSPPGWNTAKQYMAAPMLWCNTVAAAIASVAMFLLVFVWIRREGSNRREPGQPLRQAIADCLARIAVIGSWIAALFGRENSPTSDVFRSSAPRPLAHVPILGKWLYRPAPAPLPPATSQPWWPCHGAVAAVVSGFALAWCGKIAFQGDQWPDGTVLLSMGLLLVVLIVSVRQLPRAHKAWACGLVAAMLLWFDPAVLAVSHVWPQWDVWPIPFFLVSAFLASVEWWMTAGIVLALGVMFKGQLLLPGPVLIFWPLFGGRIGPCLRALSGFVFGGAVILSPFLVSQVPQLQWIAMSAVAVLMAGALVTSLRFGSWLRILRQPAASLTAIAVGVLAWMTPRWIPITGKNLTYFHVFAAATVLLGLASLIVRFIFRFVAGADKRRVAKLARRSDPFNANVLATPPRDGVIPCSQPRAPANSAGLPGILLSTFIIAAVLGWANYFAHYLFPTLPPLVFHDSLTGTVTMTIPGHVVTSAVAAGLLVMILGIPWLLPRRALIPWFVAAFGVIIWISAFGITPPGTTASGFNGDFGWYHVGFEYGTYKFQVMQMGGTTFSNLPSILAVRYGWQIHDIVFRLDFLSIHHDVEMKQLLVSIFYIGLLLSAAGAAVNSRKNNPRVLIALAAPWVLFPVVLTQMSERYLLMSSAISIAAIAASTELSLLHIVIALVGGAMALNQAMVQRGGGPPGNSFMPSVSWLITGSHPDMGFLTTLMAIIFLGAAITPRYRRPRWLARSNRAKPKNELLPRTSLA